MKNSKKTPLQNLILICVCAFLASFSIVLGKYLAINLGDTIRISFENLPILFSGLYFGPVAGVCVGVVADLVGCVMVGYTINPVITLGAATIGLTSGIAGSVCRNGSIRRILAAVIFSHLIGSVLIKTLGLSIYFQMPFFATLAWRFLTYLIIGTAETAILILLSKSSALTKEAEKITKKGARK